MDPLSADDLWWAPSVDRSSRGGQPPLRDHDLRQAEADAFIGLIGELTGVELPADPPAAPPVRSRATGPRVAAARARREPPALPGGSVGGVLPRDTAPAVGPPAVAFVTAVSTVAAPLPAAPTPSTLPTALPLPLAPPGLRSLAPVRSRPVRSTSAQLKPVPARSVQTKPVQTKPVRRTASPCGSSRRQPPPPTSSELKVQRERRVAQPTASSQFRAAQDLARSAPSATAPSARSPHAAARPAGRAAAVTRVLDVPFFELVRSGKRYLRERLSKIVLPKTLAEEHVVWLVLLGVGVVLALMI